MADSGSANASTTQSKGSLGTKLFNKIKKHTRLPNRKDLEASASQRTGQNEAGIDHEHQALAQHKEGTTGVSTSIASATIEPTPPSCQNATHRAVERTPRSSQDVSSTAIEPTPPSCQGVPSTASKQTPKSSQASLFPQNLDASQGFAHSTFLPFLP